MSSSDKIAIRTILILGYIILYPTFNIKRRTGGSESFQTIWKKYSCLRACSCLVLETTNIPVFAGMLASAGVSALSREAGIPAVDWIPLHYVSAAVSLLLSLLGYILASIGVCAVAGVPAIPVMTLMSLEYLPATTGVHSANASCYSHSCWYWWPCYCWRPSIAGVFLLLASLQF